MAWIGYGRLIYRTRNLLFPLALVGLLACFPPAAGLDAPLWIAAGLSCIVAGQGLRVLTVGLAYIKRGGKDGRYFAHGLVTGGLFAHCRNPLYLGNLLLAVGYLLLAGNPVALLGGTLFFALSYQAIVKGEECYLAGRFKNAFEDYRRAVPRWALTLKGIGTTWRDSSFHGRRVVAKEYGTLFTTLFTTLAILAWRTARMDGWRGVQERPWLFGLLPALGGALYLLARYLKKTGRLKEAVS